MIEIFNIGFHTCTFTVLFPLLFNQEKFEFFVPKIDFSNGSNNLNFRAKNQNLTFCSELLIWVLALKMLPWWKILFWKKFEFSRQKYFQNWSFTEHLSPVWIFAPKVLSEFKLYWTSITSLNFRAKILHLGIITFFIFKDSFELRKWQIIHCVRPYCTVQQSCDTW